MPGIVGPVAAYLTTAVIAGFAFQYAAYNKDLKLFWMRVYEARYAKTKERHDYRLDHLNEPMAPRGLKNPVIDGKTTPVDIFEPYDPRDELYNVPRWRRPGHYNESPKL